MLCCVGLIGGAAVGQAMGGPWTWIGPAAGFGIGLVADMRMMRGDQETGAQQAESGACCGVASRLRRMLRLNGKEGKREMTFAEIRKTYQTGSTEPPADSRCLLGV